MQRNTGEDSAESYLWSDKLFVSSYLLSETRAEKDDFSWVEPRKPKGPNLFDIWPQTQGEVRQT